MSRRVIVKESSLQSIADAIRAVTGTDKTYTPAEMVEGIKEAYFAAFKEVYGLLDGTIKEITITDETRIEGWAFANLHLSKLDVVAAVKSWYNFCFYNSTIDTVIVRRTDAVDHYLGTALQNDTCTVGKVYVPQALLEKYKAATGTTGNTWAGFADKFYALEGSEYE